VIRVGPPAGARAERDRQAGFSIPVLLAGITIMFILMAAAVPTWKYVMKNDREEELYFRGDQIARAIERYQRKNANSLPTTLEMLVKGKYLRKIYKDPFSKDGKWRIIHPGEAVLPVGTQKSGAAGSGLSGAGGSGTGGSGFGTGMGTTSQGSIGSGLGATGGVGPFGDQPGAGPTRGFQPAGSPANPAGPGGTMGAIIGVASTSTDKSLRIFNGRTRYDQWIFLANQPRLLGGDQSPSQLPGGIGPGGARPGTVAPTPLGGSGGSFARP
jgi:type II secretory pathway pseudopilin PulG